VRLLDDRRLERSRALHGSIEVVQLEPNEPKSDELERLKKVYFRAWPDGVERQSWKDITYVRVRPTWARYNDFRPGGKIVEVDPTELRSGRSP
jgi:hypothetical protein